MKDYVISISAKRTDTVSEIIKVLSNYDCKVQINSDQKFKKYPLTYEEVSYSRLGEKRGRTAEQYKKDVKFYNTAGDVLISFGISPKHKGYTYSIECMRLILTYGADDYRMDNDVYPIISDWYEVSAKSVEHSIRNAINNAWEKGVNTEKFNESNLSVFSKKPSNVKFLKHLAKITKYSLIDADSEII